MKFEKLFAAEINKNAKYEAADYTTGFFRRKLGENTRFDTPNSFNRLVYLNNSLSIVLVIQPEIRLTVMVSMTKLGTVLPPGGRSLAIKTVTVSLFLAELQELLTDTF